MDNNASQISLEFEPDRDRAGYRLHACSVYNWGTFHGRVHTLSPEGRTALLTGANGSGKSTLVDALLTLFVDPRRRNYNQASGAGQKRERTEKDYILGAYSEKHDSGIGRNQTLTLRKPGESVTILRALFFNENYQAYVSLAQVLWVNTAGRVDRAYVVQKRKLGIEGDFADLSGPSEVRARLRERGLEPLDTFEAYRLKFHECLGLPGAGRSPMDIFNQAVCIKDILNLTQFIRDYMLDDGGAAEKLVNLRKNFNELRTTYQIIERDKVRLEKLDSIKAHHEEIARAGGEIMLVTRRIEALRPFFAKKEIALRAIEGERLASEAARLKIGEDAARREAGEHRGKAREIRRLIEQSDTGRRLREIDEAIKRNEPLVKERSARRAKIEKRLREWRVGASLDSENAFEILRRECAEARPGLEKDADERRVKLSELERQRKENLQAQDGLNGQIRYYLEHKNNIPGEYAERRDRIAKAVGAKPEKLPYVAELVQVKDGERDWTGALERLLHNFALTIVVPAQLRAKVDTFVHCENQRGLVVYNVVEDRAADRRAVADGSAAAKLEISPNAGVFSEWLARELAIRFPHSCFNEPGEGFNRAESALTINGLIKQRGGERRKDDRGELTDRTNYVLGWDSREKIRAFEAELEKLRADERNILANFKQAQESLAKVNGNIRVVGDLGAMIEVFGNWSALDWESLAAESERLRVEYEKLRKDSSELAGLENELAAEEKAEKDADQRSREIGAKIAETALLSKQNAEEAGKCEKILAEARATSVDANFAADLDFLETRLPLPVSNIREIPASSERMRNELGRERGDLNRSYNDHVQAVKLEMEKFLALVKAEDPRLHDSLFNANLPLPGYNDTLYDPYGGLREKILADDLPKNEKRFEQLLHGNVVDEVSNFDAILDAHARAIVRRIAELNERLREVNFDRPLGTFIQLVQTRSGDDSQKRFREMRRTALGDSARQDTPEARRASYLRIEAFLAELEKDEVWTQRVIDVRNWFDFRADEFFRNSDGSQGELRQSYSGASGKSGGEKNRLASTILATAIAYQYGISVNNRQSDTFRLVAVDEMFSKTDDEFSTYLLELFREFHLQLIIIQPLDSKIHLVQKFVERYHIVTRRGEVSSIRNLSVREYADATGNQSP